MKPLKNCICFIMYTFHAFVHLLVRYSLQLKGCVGLCFVMHFVVSVRVLQSREMGLFAFLFF